MDGNYGNGNTRTVSLMQQQTTEHGMDQQEILDFVESVNRHCSNGISDIVVPSKLEDGECCFCNLGMICIGPYCNGRRGAYRNVCKYVKP